MFNFIDYLHFYSCEWLCKYGPSSLLCLGVYNAVKTALVWMESYLNDRTQRVAVGSVSKAMYLQCGVSQSFCFRAQIVLYFCKTNQ
jgi:hypothetical protein